MFVVQVKRGCTSICCNLVCRCEACLCYVGSKDGVCDIREGETIAVSSQCPSIPSSTVYTKCIQQYICTCSLR